MSYDFQIKQACTHLVVEEILQVASDRQSLYLDRPPTATLPNQLLLKANGFEILQDNPVFGYTLVRDEKTFINPFVPIQYNQIKKKIFFKKKLKALDDIFEVSYYTDAWNCRRCHNLRVEDDIRFDSIGAAILVTNEQKLIQDVQKWVFTVLGSNQFHDVIGTNIFLLIGQKITDSSVLRMRIIQEITSSLQIYLQKQQQQANIQVVPAQEMLYQVDVVDAEIAINEPTALNIRITFSNRTTNGLEIIQKVTVPGMPVLIPGNRTNGPAPVGTGGTLRLQDVDLSTLPLQ